MGTKVVRTPVFMSWLKQVHEDRSFHTRRFFSLVELHSYFSQTTDEIVSLKSFARNINKIVDEGLYPFLRRREKRTSKKKTVITFS